MCRIPQKGSRSNELTLRELEVLIDQIANWQVRYISFAGGEPLLRKEDVIRLIKYAKTKSLFVALITSGYLLNRKTCAELLSSGLDKLTISIDGSQKRTHDLIRGRGTFGQALRAARCLAKLRVDGGFSTELEFATCVMSYNFRELIDIYHLMRSVGFDYINYQAVVPDNLTYPQDPTLYEVPFWLNEEEVKELEPIIEQLIKLKERTGRIRNTKRYLRLMPDYFRLKQLFRPDRCLAGFRILNIDAQGNLNICGFGPNLNVRNGKLAELWKSKEYQKTRLRIKGCKIPCMMLCYEKLNLRSLIKSWFEAKLGERLNALKA
jgi:MoaA/NifB/PqqE/SkfB family radical SAM enzyme